jgi:hypothetical protein
VAAAAARIASDTSRSVPAADASFSAASASDPAGNGRLASDPVSDDRVSDDRVSDDRAAGADREAAGEVSPRSDSASSASPVQAGQTYTSRFFASINSRREVNARLAPHSTHWWTVDTTRQADRTIPRTCPTVMP